MHSSAVQVLRAHAAASGWSKSHPFSTLNSQVAAKAGLLRALKAEPNTPPAAEVKPTDRTTSVSDLAAKLAREEEELQKAQEHEGHAQESAAVAIGDSKDAESRLREMEQKAQAAARKAAHARKQALNAAEHQSELKTKLAQLESKKSEAESKAGSAQEEERALAAEAWKAVSAAADSRQRGEMATKAALAHGVVSLPSSSEHVADVARERSHALSAEEVLKAQVATVNSLVKAKAAGAPGLEQPLAHARAALATLVQGSEQSGSTTSAPGHPRSAMVLLGSEAEDQYKEWAVRWEGAQLPRTGGLALQPAAL